ncbi:MAG: sigma-54 dependent transcriptional regulator [Pseudomonadota bacterium]
MREVVFVDCETARSAAQRDALRQAGWSVDSAAESWPAERLSGASPGTRSGAQTDHSSSAARWLCVVCVYGDADFAQIAQIAQRASHATIVALLAEDSVAAAMRAIRAGASDCVARSAPPEALPARLAAYRADPSMLEPTPALLPADGSLDEAEQADPAGWTGRAEGAFDGLITTAPAIQAAVAAAKRAAPSQISVLLTGPSGSGKERFASAIHAASPRRDSPFIAVNCGALPEQLVESTLFGHEKGAFTGADRAAPGRVRAADGGTLFLDEVGDLPALAQVKLLRFLQDGRVDPVGGRDPVAVDVRVLAATNRDLRADIAAGRFREDLFFRLAGFEINLPPLRARREDVLPLALRHAQTVAALEARPFIGFAPGVEDWLSRQDWPGNVRELHNAVHRALVMSDAPLIAQSAFDIQRIATTAAPGGTETGIVDATEDAGDTGDKGGTGDAERAGSAAGLVSAARRRPPQIRRLEEVEAETIADALLLCRGNVSLAARKLGIGRSTLYRKMASFGVAQPDGADATVDLIGP